MADIVLETTIKPEIAEETNKTKSLNRVFTDLLENHDLEMQLSKTRENIDLITGPYETNPNPMFNVLNKILITPDQELTVYKEREDGTILKGKKVYKLDKETGKILNEKGEEFSENYDFFFPGTDSGVVGNVQNRIYAFFRPTTYEVRKDKNPRQTS